VSNVKAINKSSLNHIILLLKSMSVCTYFDHFEFLKVNPRLEDNRRFFVVRSKYNLFLKIKEGGSDLNLIQLKIKWKITKLLEEIIYIYKMFYKLNNFILLAIVIIKRST